MPRGKRIWNLDLSPDSRNVESDKSSCTAHALAAVLNCPLHTAQTITFCAGRRQNVGFYSQDLIQWCNAQFPGMFTALEPNRVGYLPYVYPDTVPNSLVGKRCYINIPGHALAIINSKFVDSAMAMSWSLGKPIRNIWVLMRPEVTAEMLLNSWKNLEF